MGKSVQKITEKVSSKAYTSPLVVVFYFRNAQADEHQKKRTISGFYC